MKKEWSDVALGEILIRRKRQITIDDTEYYKRVTIRLNNNGVALRDRQLGEQIGTKIQFRVREGDFLISKIDARNGAFGVVPASCEDAIITGNFWTFDVNQSLSSARYLYWLAKSRMFLNFCIKASEGTTNRRYLQEDAFSQLPISLPPLAEQQRLVAYLDAIESRLTRAQKLREEQDHEHQAALRSAFHRLEAVAEWRPMAEVAPLIWRQIAIDPDASYTEYGVRSFYKGIFLRRKVPGSTFSWQDLYRVQAGDIVFSNIMAWEKAIAVAGPEQDGWVGNHRMLVCEPRRDLVLPSCIHHYFMTADGFAKILQASPGTAARNKTLKVESLMEIRVPVPPMSQQIAFDALCQQLAQLRAARPPQAAEMNALLPSLLDRTFNS